MKKSKLTRLFVIALAGFVPLFVQSQANPGAKAEAKAANAAQIPEKSVGRRATALNQLAPDAPGSYVVVKGDTLWDIAGRFLKEPWRWPEIWNMNREQIKNPHWIYPGDVIKLLFDENGNPYLSLANGERGENVRLQPRARVDTLATAIPSIPSKVISPFLSLPLVIDEGALANAPRIIATEDGRVGAHTPLTPDQRLVQQATLREIFEQHRERKVERRRAVKRPAGNSIPPLGLPQGFNGFCATSHRGALGSGGQISKFEAC